MIKDTGIKYRHVSGSAMIYSFVPTFSGNICSLVNQVIIFNLLFLLKSKTGLYIYSINRLRLWSNTIKLLTAH